MRRATATAPGPRSWPLSGARPQELSGFGSRVLPPPSTQRSTSPRPLPPTDVVQRARSCTVAMRARNRVQNNRVQNTPLAHRAHTRWAALTQLVLEHAVAALPRPPVQALLDRIEADGRFYDSVHPLRKCWAARPPHRSHTQPCPGAAGTTLPRSHLAPEADAATPHSKLRQGVLATPCSCTLEAAIPQPTRSALGRFPPTTGAPRRRARGTPKSAEQHAPQAQLNCQAPLPLSEACDTLPARARALAAMCPSGVAGAASRGERGQGRVWQPAVGTTPRCKLAAPLAGIGTLGFRCPSPTSGRISDMVLVAYDHASWSSNTATGQALHDQEQSHEAYHGRSLASKACALSSDTPE